MPKQKLYLDHTWGASCYQYAFNLVNCKSFRSVLVSNAPGVADSSVLEKHLLEMCSLKNMTSFKVHIDPTTCKHSVSSVLSGYVGTTNPPKKCLLISLSFEYPYNQSDSTWTSSSSSELCVRLTFMTKTHSERLFEYVIGCDNIRSFILWVRCAWLGTELFRHSSGGIHNNYSLLSNQLSDYKMKASFAVWDTTRSNFGLLASAARDLAGSRV
ncbi:hypothetical protein MRX96_056901 [Rhipicephalus microplus]